MFKNITAINLYKNELRNRKEIAGGLQDWRAKYLYTFVNWSSAIFSSEFMGEGSCQVILPLKNDYISLFKKTLEEDFFLLELIGEKEGDNHTVFFVDNVVFEETDGIQTMTINGSDFLNIYNKMGIYRFDIAINFLILTFSIDNMRLKNLTAVKNFPSTNLFLLALQCPVQAFKDTDSFKELTDTDFTSIYPKEMGILLQEENFLISKENIKASESNPYILAPYDKAMTLLKELRETYNYGISNTQLSAQRDSASSTDVYYRVEMKVKNGTKNENISLSTLKGTFKNPSRTIDLSVKGIGGKPVIRGQAVPETEAGTSSGEKYLGTNAWTFTKSDLNLAISVGKDIKINNVDDQTFNFGLTGVKPPLKDTASTYEIKKNSKATDIRHAFLMLKRISDRDSLCEADKIEGTIVNVDGLNLGDIVKVAVFGVQYDIIITGFTYYSDATSFTTEVQYEFWNGV